MANFERGSDLCARVRRGTERNFFRALDQMPAHLVESMRPMVAAAKAGWADG